MNSKEKHSADIQVIVTNPMLWADMAREVMRGEIPDTEKAVQFLKQAIALDKTNALYYYELAELYFRNDREADAVEALDQAVQYDETPVPADRREALWREVQHDLHPDKEEFAVVRLIRELKNRTLEYIRELPVMLTQELALSRSPAVARRRRVDQNYFEINLVADSPVFVRQTVITEHSGRGPGTVEYRFSGVNPALAGHAALVWIVPRSVVNSVLAVEGLPLEQIESRMMEFFKQRAMHDARLHEMFEHTLSITGHIDRNDADTVLQVSMRKTEAQAMLSLNNWPVIIVF